MDDIFKDIETAFIAQEATRDRLRERREKADTKLRSVLRAAQKVHASDDLLTATKSVSEELRTCGELIKAIEEALPEQAGAYDRYADMWHSQTQVAVMLSVWVGFLLDDTLIDKEKVGEMVGADVRIRLEDYLIGICLAIQELSRLSINRVIKGDYNTPKRCAKFVNDVFGAMMQLNFRNDGVRKKFDGVKYDVKRVDEIVYDLSIRGLLVEVKVAGGTDKEGCAPMEEAGPADDQGNGK
eukprot:GFKZ01007021.1.p2 GENE.GFKZ01007021.1~~GFKZ01007021.1.p2  ORF type:complete len:240 (+),score=52.98 GFKZ01007021.1:104-823(+)